MIEHKFPEKEVCEKNDKVMEHIKDLCNATINLWKDVKKDFIPTPQKFTYNFTMKDLSKIFNGLFRIATTTLKNSKAD
jgi:dynein heavy chain